VPLAAGTLRPADGQGAQPGAQEPSALVRALALRHLPTLSPAQVMAALGCSEATATRILRAALGAGLIQRVGRGRYCWMSGGAKQAS
jgi:Transcriptional regulator, AbiEi antitoxin